MSNFVWVFHSAANSELNSNVAQFVYSFRYTQYYQFCVLYTEETGFTVKHTQTHYHPTSDPPLHTVRNLPIEYFFAIN